MRTLNLGILAHVDAGKTTLTERLLYAAGVIDEIGSVDAGSTQTDFLALERQRGITIKSAVVSFVLPSAAGDVTVNLIDTPGHPDFIAEVERVLNVLDGAVLVISAVEGVQAQTRVLMRTLRRLGVPTLLFVNKIDRRGARDKGVLEDIRQRLTPAVVPMTSTCDLGTRHADVAPYGAEDASFTAALTDVLADHDERILKAYVDDDAVVAYDRLRDALVGQTKRTRVHPVFFGSAITGAGVAVLIEAITEFLPAPDGDADGKASGTVFKVERGPAGERVAYVRMFSGTIRARDRVGDDQKVTAIRVFDRGASVQQVELVAGRIGKLWGLAEIQIGDAIGVPRANREDHHFAPPTLETVVVPARRDEKGALHAALAQLAEQDPLIRLRQDDVRGELSVSLYGEVQKEVIQQTLASDYGLDVTFRETTMICIERPSGTGTAVELMHKRHNPFLATVGLRIEPAPVGSGVELRVDVDVRSVPLYVFKTVEDFHHAMQDTVCATLRQGLYGWDVHDCVVTMTDCDYSSPGTKAYHYRKLTPLVVMSALKAAGTTVCEPVHRFRLECPADTLGVVLSALARLQAVPGAPVTRGSTCVVEGEIAAARMDELQQPLRSLTRGEGVVEFEFDRYEPVRGPFPRRRRSGPDPLDRGDYLRQVTR
jgi:ribosomal protection tetracycline resistance protein